MRKGLLIGYIVLFFAVCAVPGVTLLLGVESPNYENRTLSSLPVLWDEEGFNAEFTQQFDTYFSENFGLRPLLVTANAGLRASLLRDSASARVIIGREGWLYFTDTLDDYLGRDPLNDGDIDRLVRTLALQQEILAGRDVFFLVALAPNKNTIYPEYMPARLTPQSDRHNLDALQAAMAQTGVNYVDLKSALLDARREGLAYHKLDTHWNNFGALRAYRAVMEAVAVRLPGFAWDDYAAAASVTQRSWMGDLSTMLLPSMKELDDQIVYDIPQNYRSARPIHSLEDISIQTGSDVNDTGLLIFRDSFCNALLPLLSNAFGQVQYSRAVPYDYRLMDNADARVVVLEIVERNIPELLQYAPLLAAPGRELPDAPVDPGMAAVVGVREAAGGLVIYGSSARDGQVTVRLTGAQDAGFEPFPILSDSDAAALPEGMQNSYGFTMYLPEGTLPAGEYSVSVVVEAGGAAVSSGTVAEVTLS